MIDRAAVWLRRCFCAWMSATSIMIVSGCGAKSGPERANVSGEVTLDGQPVEKGVIAFVPDGATQGPTAGAAILGGKYATPPGSGPVLGTHRVEITAHRMAMVVEGAGIGGGGVGPSGGVAMEKSQMYVPTQYNKNSTLTFEVKSGKNVQDFPLKSAP
ncbi:MAG: hypothetical protein JWP89_5080 [Schlesneria sp.]|nr:hypothetical protein [Schlesneria sp.]